MSTTLVPTPTSVLRLGHAHGDITPPVGIYHRMWGAARHDRATGVHRPLMADVLVLEPVDRPRERLVRVQLDHVLLDDGQTDAVVAGLVRAAGVDRDRVVVTFSHTHAAGFYPPDRIPLPGGDLIEPYLAGLGETLGSLARDALEDLDEAVVTYAEGRCGMAANRDYHDEERDLRVTGFNPGEAAEDLVVAARVTALDGTPRLHLVHYACHPTTLSWDNSLLSPDFVGAARQVVSDHTGTPCVYFQGLCGELGPRDGFTGDTEVADRNGRQLGFAALSALAGLGPPGHDFAYQGPVLSGATIGTWGWTPVAGPRAEAVRRWSVGRFQVDLPFKDLPDVDQLRADLDRHTRDQARADEAGDALAARDAGARAERCRRWLRRLAELPPGDRCPYRFTVHEMGDALWITCAAEPYSDAGDRAAAALPRPAGADLARGRDPAAGLPAAAGPLRPRPLPGGALVPGTGLPGGGPGGDDRSRGGPHGLTGGPVAVTGPAGHRRVAAGPTGARAPRQQNPSGGPSPGALREEEP